MECMNSIAYIVTYVADARFAMVDMCMSLKTKELDVRRSPFFNRVIKRYSKIIKISD